MLRSVFWGSAILLASGFPSLGLASEPLQGLRNAIVGVESKLDRDHSGAWGGRPGALGRRPGRDSDGEFGGRVVPGQPPAGGFFRGEWMGGVPMPSLSRTGFIIADAGHVLTILDFPSDQSRVSVTLADGQRVDAKPVAWDRTTGLTVLKCEEKEGLSGAEALQLAEASPAWASKIDVLYFWSAGNPALAGGRVATAPQFDVDLLSDTFQLDVAVRPATAGAPILNADGQVVGIVKAKRPAFGQEGSVVAVERSLIAKILQFTSEGGSGGLPKPMLGVGLSQDGSAVQITSITRESPAEQAGLQLGDELRVIDGQAIRGSDAVMAAVARRNPGDELEMTILRGDEELQLTVTLGARAQVEQADEEVAVVTPFRMEAFPLDEETLRNLPGFDGSQWMDMYRRFAPPQEREGQKADREPDSPTDLRKQMQALGEQLRQLQQQLNQAIQPSEQ